MSDSDSVASGGSEGSEDARMKAMLASWDDDNKGDDSSESSEEEEDEEEEKKAGATKFDLNLQDQMMRQRQVLFLGALLQNDRAAVNLVGKLMQKQTDVRPAEPIFTLE